MALGKIWTRYRRTAENKLFKEEVKTIFKLKSTETLKRLTLFAYLEIAAIKGFYILLFNCMSDQRPRLGHKRATLHSKAIFLPLLPISKNDLQVQVQRSVLHGCTARHLSGPAS